MSSIQLIVDCEAEKPPRALPPLGLWSMGRAVMVKHPDRPFDGYTGRIVKTDSYFDEDGIWYDTVTVAFDEPEPVVEQNGVEMPILNVTVVYEPYRIELLND